jgi:uncharacterized protein YbbC (DUF1343 family)
VISFGIDVLRRTRCEALKGQRVGAIVNPTSVDADFVHLIDILRETSSVSLAALFGPEHGLRGEAQYMISVDGVAREAKTQVPVYSLYGSTFESLTPTAASLAGLDVLVFDIQDVGSRYYTYLATMALAMKAAAQARVKFLVLDRPNPLGLKQVEGNLVGALYRSFVGLYALPNRHGMTAGEIAKLLNAEEKIGVELEVIACEGLDAKHEWNDLQRAFVPPSPNMPTVDTALVYPGLCLLEGTNVSEGRGTCRPFEQFGAPWLDSQHLSQTLNQAGLPGVTFRACSFTPTFDKYAGQSCEGAFIHVTQRDIFLPLKTGISIVKACREMRPQQFAWRADAYEFVSDIPAFDLLCGTAQVREGIEKGQPVERLMFGFEKELASFEALRRRYALYA